MKTKAKEQFDPLEHFAFKVIEETFKESSRDCKFRFLDEKGRANCSYQDSSVGMCQPEFCPKLRESGNYKEEAVNESEGRSS